MKHSIQAWMLGAAAILLSSCGSVAPVTATPNTGPDPGTYYGMSRRQVLAEVARTDTLLKTSGEDIVSVGPHGPLGHRTRKTFMFQGGKLKAINYNAL